MQSLVDTVSNLQANGHGIHFLQLPPEVHFHIAKGLEHASLNALSKTCRRMYEICSDNAIWKAFYFREGTNPSLKGYRFYQQNALNWKVLFQTTYRIRHQLCTQINIVHPPSPENFPWEKDTALFNLSLENDRLAGLARDDQIFIWNPNDGSLCAMMKPENRKAVSFQHDWLIYKHLYEKDKRKCSLKMCKIGDSGSETISPLTLLPDMDTSQRIFVSERWAFGILQSAQKICFFNLEDPSVKALIPFPQAVGHINEIQCVNDSAILFLPNNKIYFIPSIIHAAGFFLAPLIVPDMKNCHVIGESLLLLSSFLQIEIWDVNTRSLRCYVDLRSGFPPNSSRVGQVRSSHQTDGKLAVGTIHGYVLVIDLATLCVQSAWDTKGELAHVLLMGDCCVTAGKAGPLKFWEWRRPDRGCKEREIHPFDEFYLMEWYRIQELSFDGRRLLAATSDGHITILDYLPQQLMGLGGKDKKKNLSLKKPASGDIDASPSKRSRKIC